MTSQKHIRELAAREVEVQRTLELLQQALTATTNASMMMAEQSAEAYHSIQEVADAHPRRNPGRSALPSRGCRGISGDEPR